MKLSIVIPIYFNEDNIIVLASEHYDPDEYIRDYDQYLKGVLI